MSQINSAAAIMQQNGQAPDGSPAAAQIRPYFLVASTSDNSGTAIATSNGEGSVILKTPGSSKFVVQQLLIFGFLGAAISPMVAGQEIAGEANSEAAANTGVTLGMIDFMIEIAGEPLSNGWVNASKYRERGALAGQLPVEMVLTPNMQMVVKFRNQYTLATVHCKVEAHGYIDNR